MQGERSCAGSGLEELAVAGGLVASESVQNIVWRNYNKGMHFHKLVVEALIHILVKDYTGNNLMTTDNLVQITEVTIEQ